MVGGVDEDQLAAAAAEFGKEGDEDANPVAIDVADFGEVDGAMGKVFAEVVVNSLEELVSIGTANKVASEADEEDAVLDGAGGGHTGVLWRAAAWARQSPQMP